MSDRPTREHLLWCVKHDASATGQTDRCLAALNAALRLGINPFDSYNNRKLGKCTLKQAVLRSVEEDEK